MARRRPARTVSVEVGQDCLVGRFGAMASPCEILIESAARADASRLTRIAAGEAWRIEDRFSRYLADNVVARINTSAGRPVEVDEETASLIDFAATLHRLSDGRFDITSGALREVWTFDSGDHVPSATAIATVLQDVVLFSGIGAEQAWKGG